MKQADRYALREWDELCEAIKTSTTVDQNESTSERLKRIKNLEAHPVEWCKHYFPHYATSEFAPFHLAYIKRIINNPEWYEVVSWSRELAKDTVTMMVMFYLNLTGKKRFTIFVSSSYDAACDLLAPYMLNYENNQRIINDYGEQKTYGSWETGDFTTKCGARYVAVGAGQSPRGKKNEALRPDSIICTDLDTDEDCRNTEVINNRFSWVEAALYMTRSISKPLLFLMLGNIIAKDCCVTRAAKIADKHDIVNIRDKQGKSTWPAKNTEEMIDRVLSKMSTKAQEAECFNNPVSEGTTFKEITWGKVPPLQRFSFLVAYGDPAPSNKEAKGKTGACYKSLFLLGGLEGNLYVITGFLQHVKNAEYVQWYYDIEAYVRERSQVYNYIENNSLQDPFYEQVFIPLFAQLGKEKGHYINISPDSRKKPDKFARIEGNLEPLNRQGRLILNEAEKGNPHMQRLEEQFKLIDPKLSALCDGPDAVEGGWYIINNKTAASAPIVIGARRVNSKRM